MDMFHRNGQTDPDINAIPGPTPMTSQITMATSTSSTIAPPSKPTPNLTTSPATATTQYLIATKSGTSLEAFEALIGSLPDAGQGTKIVYPHVSFQSYVTMLSDAEAVQVAQNPIVSTVIINAELEEGSY
jgi:hypothetical protein